MLVCVANTITVKKQLPQCFSDALYCGGIRFDFVEYGAIPLVQDNIGIVLFQSHFLFSVYSAQIVVELQLHNIVSGFSYVRFAPGPDLSLRAYLRYSPILFCAGDI